MITPGFLFAGYVHPAEFRIQMCDVKRVTSTQHESGQALVEFALVLLFVILPITFVLIDGTLTLFTLANVTNAAREGARGGSIYQTPQLSGQFPDQVAQIDAARLAFAQQQASSLLGPLVAISTCTTTVTYEPCTGSLCIAGRPDLPPAGNTYRELDSMTVTVACPRRLLFGLAGTSQITLTGQSTMRIEPGGAAPPTPTP